MASDITRAYGEDDAFFQLEKGLDQLGTFALRQQLPQDHIIEIEDRFFRAFLKTFSNNVAFPVMEMALYTRLERMESSGQPLPSGRSVREVVQALRPVAEAFGAQALQPVASVSVASVSPTRASSSGHDLLVCGQVKSVNDPIAISHGVNVAPTLPGTDTMSNIQKTAVSSPTVSYSTNMLNTRVGKFVFRESTSLPTFDELRSVLKNSCPSLLCPQKNDFTRRGISYPKARTGTTQLAKLTFYCQCGDELPPRSERIKLMVIVPILPDSSPPTPMCQEYEIWRNGDIEHVAGEGTPLAWEKDGSLSKYLKDFIKNNIVPDMGWREMRDLVDHRFGHTVSQGPSGYLDAAQNFFRKLKAKLAPESLLKGRSLNDVMQFVAKNDVFQKANILQLINDGRSAAPEPDFCPEETLHYFERLLGIEENNLEGYCTVAVNAEDIPAEMSDEEKSKAMATIFIVSPSMFINLHQFLDKLDYEIRAFHGDETYHFVRTDQLFIAWGANNCDIYFKHNVGLIRQHFRPILYQFTLIRSSWCGILALKMLKRISAKIFHKEFSPKFFISDYATALRLAVTIELPQAVLVRCYFHVIGLLLMGKWKKYIHDDNNEPTIKWSIIRLHRCITEPQNHKLAELCIAEWTALGETDFAKFFHVHVGPTSPCEGKWYLGCMERVGLTPDNQSLENYFREVKGLPESLFHNVDRKDGVFRLNRELHDFVEYELKKLMRYDARYRTGIDNYRLASNMPFHFIPTEWLAHAAMIKFEDIFVLPGGRQVLVPKPWRLLAGMPPTQEVADKFISALSGHSDDPLETAEKFASRTEDWHLVTLLPRTKKKKKSQLQEQESDDDVFEKTRHFHFGTVCLCAHGWRYHNCVGQIVVKSFFTKKGLDVSLKRRCERILVTKKRQRRRTSRKRKYFERRRGTIPDAGVEELGLSQPDYLITYLFSLSRDMLESIIRTRGVQIPRTEKGPLCKRKLVELCIAGTSYAASVLESRQAAIDAARSGNRLLDAHNSMLENATESGNTLLNLQNLHNSIIGTAASLVRQDQDPFANRRSESFQLGDRHVEVSNDEEKENDDSSDDEENDDDRQVKELFLAEDEENDDSSDDEENDDDHQVKELFLAEEEKGSEVCGLINVGNTCYQNAILQMLVTCRHFMQRLHQACNSDAGILTQAVCNVDTDLKKRQSFPADPRTVKEAMDRLNESFKGYGQHDAHEFLSSLVDLLHEEAASAAKRNQSTKLDNNNNNNNNNNSLQLSQDYPTDDFGLTTQFCLECQKCGYTRGREEIYRNLSLTIVRDETADDATVDETADDATVEQSLADFFQQELRELKCEKCVTGTRVNQTLHIVKRPKILVLHLKRFNWVRNNAAGNRGEHEFVCEKDRTKVNIPLTLTLDLDSPESDNTTHEYSLQCIVYHTGKTARSGHYFVDAVRRDDYGRVVWYRIDDRDSKRLGNGEDVVGNAVNQRNAYMLLYILKEDSPVAEESKDFVQTSNQCKSAKKQSDQAILNDDDRVEEHVQSSAPRAMRSTKGESEYQYALEIAVFESIRESAILSKVDGAYSEEEAPSSRKHSCEQDNSDSEETHKLKHSSKMDKMKMQMDTNTFEDLHPGFKKALLRPWNHFQTDQNGKCYNGTVSFLKKLSTLASSDDNIDCRTLVANSKGDFTSIFPRGPPEHSGELMRKKQEILKKFDISYLLDETEWIWDHAMEEYQRLLTQLQNGDILTLAAEKGRKKRRIFARRLGHTRNPLHMLSTNHFNLLKIVNGRYATRSLMKLIPTRNVEMYRREQNACNNRQERVSRAELKIPFRSRNWDSRFLSIPINIANGHWAGVIVERHERCEEDKAPSGTLHYYDLLTKGTDQKNLRQRTMEAIGESLNLVTQQDADGDADFLDPFQWKYSDVVTAEWMEHNGTIQKDGYSCGVIWMMILWFVVTNEKAPTLEDCQQLWTSEEDLKNFRFWVAYSILADQIWLPQEITNIIGENHDDREAPSYEQWLQNLCKAVISKVPVNSIEEEVVVLDGNASSPTNSKRRSIDDEVEVVLDGNASSPTNSKRRKIEDEVEFVLSA